MDNLWLYGLVQFGTMAALLVIAASLASGPSSSSTACKRSASISIDRSTPYLRSVDTIKHLFEISLFYRYLRNLMPCSMP